MASLSVSTPNSYTPLPSSPTSTPSLSPTCNLPPLDSSNDRTLVCAFFLLGIGVLLPWNAFLSTLDFYTVLFPSISIAQFITNGYTFPFMLVGIALVISTSPLPRRLALITGFSILTLISAFLPLLTRATQPITMNPLSSPIFWFTIFAALVIGAVSAMLQSTLFAVLTCFSGDRFTTAFTTGGGVASVLVVMLRIMCRVFSTSTGKQLSDAHRSFYIFFVACALLCTFCVFVMLALETVSRQYRQRAVNMDKDDGMIRNVRATLREMWTAGLDVFTSMMITLAVFPGILVKPPMDMRHNMKDNMKSWYPLLVIAVFAVGDTVGRAMVSEKMIQKWSVGLTALVVVRIIALPIYIALWEGMGRIRWGSICVSVAFLGVANGMVVTMGFLKLPHLVPMDRRATAGRLMFVCLIPGISVGNVLGWVIEATLNRVTNF